MDKVLSQTAPGAFDRSPPPAIYALSAWSVKQSERGWHIAKTTPRFDGKPQWSPPYKTIKLATLAIGNYLAQEARARHRRRAAFHDPPR